MLNWKLFPLKFNKASSCFWWRHKWPILGLEPCHSASMWLEHSSHVNIGARPDPTPRPSCNTPGHSAHPVVRGLAVGLLVLSLHWACPDRPCREPAVWPTTTYTRSFVNWILVSVLVLRTIVQKSLITFSTFLLTVPCLWILLCSLLTDVIFMSGFGVFNFTELILCAL